jgi:GNAT superfamily N-acetyltransferase
VTSPAITRATPADRDRVISTVAAAFRTDPAMRYFFPDDATYLDHLAAFCGYLFDKRVARGTVWVAESGAAAALWDAPVLNGATGAVLELPGDALDRISRYDAAVESVMPSQPHWYLGIIATHPDYAGRRLGRALIAAGVAQAREAGLPAYLETSNPANVDLYQAAGWSIVDKLTTVEVPIWVMTYAP